MGCPAAHYHAYEYIGTKSLGAERGFTLLKFDEFTDIGIECGFYFSFIGNRERGLTTRIRLTSKENFDSLKTQVEVTSSNLGELHHVEVPNIPYLDSLPTLHFDIQVGIKREGDILKLIENDTISIAFNNGLEYQFVKK